MNWKTTSVASPGQASGSMTWRKTCHSLAPSTRAASASSRRQSAEEAAHQEDAERQPQRDAGHDERPVGLQQPEVAQQVVERDHHRLERHHQPEQEEDQDQLLRPGSGSSASAYPARQERTTTPATIAAQ